MSLPDGTAVTAGRAHHGDLTLTCDAVVVGSGAGGAVVAAELADAGLEVIILEEGPKVAPADYGAMRPSEMMRQMWRDGGMSFAVGVGDTPMINMMMGRCVGGSSVLTGGVCFRTPEAVLDDWRRLHGLEGFTAADLEPFFEEVEQAIHVEEVPVRMRSRSTTLFVEGAEKLGYGIKPLRRNTEGCRGCGRCNFGCPHGAKLSVDRVYLPRAVAAGARIHSDCLVERVTHDGGRATGVTGRVLNGRDGGPGGRLTVKARRVVLSAGAFHTPLILRASGVGRRSGQVGRNLTVHPAFRVMARFDEAVEGWKGALQSAYSDSLEDERITMMGLFTPPGVLAATLPGIGDRHADAAAAIPHLAVFGGMIHDDGGGTVRRGLGREPFVTYRMSKRDRAAVPRLMQVMGEIFFAAGAKEIYLPVLGLGAVNADRFRGLDLARYKGRQLECGSQHPLGSCRMGVSEDRSVIDDRGRAWDLQELWVADGSVVPTSLGVNPQLTIMTLALRIARQMRAQKLS